MWSESESCCVIVALESSRVPLCNGEKTASESVDGSDQHGSNIDSEAASSNSVASSSAINVNERLLLSSGDDTLPPLTDADAASLSRSSLNDTGVSSAEEASTPQLASEDISLSVLAHP